MATATKTKTVFEKFDELDAEAISVGVQCAHHRTRIDEIDAEINTLTASLVRSSDNPTSVNEKIAALEAEKEIASAKVAATPAALSAIKAERKRVRTDCAAELAEHAEVKHAELLDGIAVFVAAAKTVRQAWAVSATADDQADIEPRKPTSVRGLLNVGNVFSAGALGHLDAVIAMWDDGGPRSIPTPSSLPDSMFFHSAKPAGVMFR